MNSDSNDGLQRGLTRGFALAAVIGGVIGLGILRTPGEIAGEVAEPWLFLSLWLIGGLFVLLSTAVAAELVGMTSRSGGTYTLVRRAYGPFPGFVIGWVDWLSFVGDIALKAVVTLEFLTMLAPSVEAWEKLLAVLVISFFAALQIRGVALSAKVQQVAAALIAFIVIGFSLVLLFAGPADPGDTSLHSVIKEGPLNWSLVAASIIFTYDGWLYAAYFSGEVKGGSGDVARTCIKGVVLIIGLYLMFMAALAWSVPLADLAGSDLALASALEIVVSPAAATTVIAAAVLILLAHQNLLFMGSSRVLHALAQDGLAMKQARVVARGGNPLIAVVLSWLASISLVLVGGFEFLLHLCVFFFVALYVVLILGVAILRRQQPTAERPYRAWCHPWSTAICLAGWSIVVVYQAISEPETALYALGMIAIAWPVYVYLSRKGG